MPPIFKVKVNVKIQKFNQNGEKEYERVLKNKTYYLSKFNNVVHVRDAETNGEFKVPINGYRHNPITFHGTTVDFKMFYSNDNVGTMLQFAIGRTNNTRKFFLKNFYFNNNREQTNRTIIEFDIIEKNDNKDPNYYNFFESI